MAMKDGRADLHNIIDQSVLAGLRELQDEGDPDIVAEVGGLFLKHSPDKVKAILVAAEKQDAKALQLAAHSLKSSSAYIGAMRLSSLAKDLEMKGRSGCLDGAKEGAQKLQEEFDLAMRAIEVEIQRTVGQDQ